MTTPSNKGGKLGFGHNSTPKKKSSGPSFGTKAKSSGPSFGTKNTGAKKSAGQDIVDPIKPAAKKSKRTSADRASARADTGNMNWTRR